MHRSSRLKRCFWIVAMVAAEALPSAAQQPASQQSANAGTGVAQTEDLQKQLEELKQRYQATTRDLEQRIAGLEQQIQKQKEAGEKAKEGVISAAELAAQEAAKKAALGQSDHVGAKYQGDVPSEPTYDLLEEADEKIEKLNATAQQL